MHKLELAIARLRLLSAEVEGKRAALGATRQQYHAQLERLVSFAVHDEGGVERTLAMLMDVDGRLHDLTRQEHYLSTIHDAARRELESLLLTKLVEEARAQLEALTGRQTETAGGSPSERDDSAWVAQEIRRLESVIAEASGAAAKSISSR